MRCTGSASPRCVLRVLLALCCVLCVLHAARCVLSRFPNPPNPLCTQIDKLISMSDMKYNAITSAGIRVLERVAIPDELIPADAHVEIDAKMYAVRARALPWPLPCPQAAPLSARHLHPARTPPPARP